MFLWWNAVLVTTSCWTLVVPVQALEVSNHVAPATQTQDIALGHDATLHGMCVEASGRPVCGCRVVLLQQGRQVGETQTDIHGKFAFTRLRGGVYSIVGPDATTMLRVWSPGTAPPQATQLVVLQAGDVVRGQRPFAEIITNPLVVGAVIAAAIAIPIAVHNSGKDRSGS